MSQLLIFLCVLGAANAALAADINAGKAKASATCAVCHGAQGMSSLPNAPHLAGQPQIYLAEQLKNYRSGKRTHEVMGVVAKPLSDAEIDNLSGWYASLQIVLRETP
ncbi:cytochrome c [Polaromonas sp. CG_9.11]|uniref:c-type cytochrome n=1 Tax=Polaromonas sp. CG_9.11 TaxID=2787730 RepID=UPI0018CB86E2|nr:cytochrome c [Polaromonas sp. CG_9.11]MBG6074579.1 cytochrome c553 [Polaromonas sp. CG_9.11]